MEKPAFVDVHDVSGYSPSEVDFVTQSQPSVRYRSLKAFVNRVSALSSHLSGAPVIGSALAPQYPYFWHLSSADIQVIEQGVTSFQRKSRCI